MLTHEELVAKLMERPEVRAEVESARSPARGGKVLNDERGRPFAQALKHVAAERRLIGGVREECGEPASRIAE